MNQRPMSGKMSIQFHLSPMIKPRALIVSRTPVKRANPSGTFTSRVPDKPFGLPLAFERLETTKITARKAMIA